jgi:cbb3-type cytochrome oxidase maturation protein
MSETVIILMLGVSTFLGALGLLSLIWGVKTGQFDDQSKFIDGARYDNQEDLEDAVLMDRKKEERKKRKEKESNYRPPD